MLQNLGHAGTSQPRVQNPPMEQRKKHQGSRRQWIPSQAGGAETGKPQRPQMGVETPEEKVGVKEPAQWQIHHTHHTALSHGGCVHAGTSCTQDPGPSQVSDLRTQPHPNPAGQPPPWAPQHQSHRCWELKMTDKYRPGEEPSRLRRPRNWGLRVPLPLPGFLLLLQDPYKGEAKSTLRLA